eukprot:11011468-Alexandrium_andersonii.AAC.1
MAEASRSQPPRPPRPLQQQPPLPLRPPLRQPDSPCLLVSDWRRPSSLAAWLTQPSARARSTALLRAAASMSLAEEAAVPA